MNNIIDQSALNNLDRGYKLDRIKRYSTALIKDIEKVNSRKQQNPKVDVDVSPIISSAK